MLLYTSSFSIAAKESTQMELIAGTVEKKLLGYPKSLQDGTIIKVNGYPEYRRRSGIEIHKRFEDTRLISDALFRQTHI